MTERTDATPTRLAIVLGTRPEAIKLAPLVAMARSTPKRFEAFVVATGQHSEMLDQALSAFNVRVDIDLKIMQHDQALSYVICEATKGLYQAIGDLRPDWVVVQGDTTTTLAGALAAFYNRVPVAHVEAGLRTYYKHQPFPEEINRRLTTHIADYHFAPTEAARQNLLREGIDQNVVWVTGNTCIDALSMTLAKYRDKRHRETAVRTILLTAHRRENHGKPLEEICSAVLTLLGMFSDIQFVVPVHMNPHVRRTFFSLLAGHRRIKLTEPMNYCESVIAMHESYIILTDSGGIQEEGSFLHKPVLVLRQMTERPEAITEGTARLVGTDRRAIVEATATLLRNPVSYRHLACCRNPYGDGKASWRILQVLSGADTVRPSSMTLD